MEKKKISETVEALEDQLTEALEQLGKIRTIVLVNFCDYSDKRKASIYPIWSNLADFELETTPDLILKILKHSTNEESSM